MALDLVLTQVEKAAGLPVGHIGIEPQIEDALGLTNIDQIATASPRVLTLVFGPADFMASVGMRTLTVGEQPEGYAPGDAYHHVLMTILVAARAHDLQAIDGAVMFGDEMLDEASRKMAMVVSARGRAGGMTVTDQAGAGTDPEGRTS